MRWIASLLLISCSKPTVQCGKGTVLKNGVCEVVAVAQTAPPADAAAPPDAAVLADASATEPHATWAYRKQTDAMRGATTETALIESTNIVTFRPPYGDAHMAIFIRYEPQGARDPGTAVILQVESGQFDCSFEGCAISEKLDDGKVEPWPAAEAAGGITKAILLRRAPEWIAKTKRTKHLVIEAPFYQDGRRQFEFDVGGLKWDH